MISENGVAILLQDWKRSDMKYFLFDIGHVLFDFDYQEFLDAVARDTGKPCAPLTGRDLQMHDAVETGEISDEQWVLHLNESFGLSWTVSSLTDLWSRMFKRNETGCRLFDQARKSGIAVHTLSNIAKHHIDAIENNWNGFFDGVAGMFLSYQIGVRKPHPYIYRYVLKQLGTEAHQCFFIDDHSENIKAAHAVGIQAHQFISENHEAVRQAAGAFFG